MFRQFKFEEEITRGRSYIPAAARYKLDLIGIRVSLRDWNRFREEERAVLCHLSVRSQGEKDCYKGFVLFLFENIGERAEFLDPSELNASRIQWENPVIVPASVIRKAKESGLSLTEENWLRMDDLERYVLFTMAHEKYSPRVFQLAVEEFGSRTKSNRHATRAS